MTGNGSMDLEQILMKGRKRVEVTDVSSTKRRSGETPSLRPW
ncbi:hypothetical protein [Ornithinimicrobium sp. CNJ-824]|nr:hypothetical protein [Ornithinimicrobium sp. CNJ-824]